MIIIPFLLIATKVASYLIPLFWLTDLPKIENYYMIAAGSLLLLNQLRLACANDRVVMMNIGRFFLIKLTIMLSILVYVPFTFQETPMITKKLAWLVLCLAFLIHSLVVVGIDREHFLPEAVSERSAMGSTLVCFRDPNLQRIKQNR